MKRFTIFFFIISMLSLSLFSCDKEEKEEQKVCYKIERISIKDHTVLSTKEHRIILKRDTFKEEYSGSDESTMKQTVEGNKNDFCRNHEINPYYDPYGDDEKECSSIDTLHYSTHSDEDALREFLKDPTFDKNPGTPFSYSKCN